MSHSGRCYDKGERRYKHVGRHPYATVEYSNGNPKKPIGKCPNNLSDTDRLKMLEQAIPGSQGDRNLPYPPELYCIRDGVIYKAATTTAGQSYHGFPYAGSLPRKLYRELERMANKIGEEYKFKIWVEKHISVPGVT